MSLNQATLYFVHLCSFDTLMIRLYSEKTPARLEIVLIGVIWNPASQLIHDLSLSSPSERRKIPSITQS